MLLIGTPCSGKSTIGSLLAIELSKKLVKLDDFIQLAVKINNIKSGEILTDAFIDDAVRKFISHIDKNYQYKQFIYELPYHNYIQLFAENEIISKLRIIGFKASIEEIFSRNKKREITFQIPESYLVRCNEAMNDLAYSSDYKVVFYNTEIFSFEAIINDIIHLINQHD